MQSPYPPRPPCPPRPGPTPGESDRDLIAQLTKTPAAKHHAVALLLTRHWRATCDYAVVCLASATPVAQLVASAAFERVLGRLTGGAVGGATTAVSAVQYALAPALYPTEMRGTGVGAAVSIGRLGSIAGPLVAGSLMSLGYGGSEILFAMLPVTAGAAIAATALSRRISTNSAR